MMIPKTELIALFERMEREHWRYEWGAAREGVVDCSGAFVWAYKQFGEAIYHGSNTIAREYVGELVPVSEAEPGFAVFKVREWGNGQKSNRWYKKAPGDIYHVGLLGRDGRVLNAQSTKTGFVASPLSQNWAYAAKLLVVEENGEAQGVMGRAKVITQKDPLRIRARPKDGAVLGQAPRGAIVDVLDAQREDGWMRIAYDGVTGYADGRYLEWVEEETTLINEQGRRAILPGIWRVE